MVKYTFTKFVYVDGATLRIYLTSYFFFHFMVKSGICYREESRFTEAESLLKEWLPIAEKIKGKQSVLVGRISGLLGDVYRHMHMYNESQ